MARDSKPIITGKFGEHLVAAAYGIRPFVAEPTPFVKEGGELFMHVDTITFEVTDNGEAVISGVWHGETVWVMKVDHYSGAIVHLAGIDLKMKVTLE